jgi:hypothetical protein
LRLNISRLGGFALYLPFQTSLIADLHQQFTDLQYDGTRAIEFCEGLPPDRAQIEIFIRRALPIILLAVTSREVVRLFLKQFRFDFVPLFHGLQGRFAA